MDMVNGYRLIRKLGEGARAQVWLAHSVRNDDRAVAIKLYRSSTSLESIDVEIEALVRAESAHILTLDDVATARDDRPCLVMPRLTSLSLTRLLLDPASISAGQLVTALAPIASAVSELHRVGVIHGGIESSTILLDKAGAPVLSAFARAHIIGPKPESGLRSLSAAELAEEPRVIADRRGLITLVGALARRVSDDAEVASTGQLIEWAETALCEDDFLDRLADHLFELAPATALSFDDATPATTRQGTLIGRDARRSATQEGASAVYRAPVSKRMRVRAFVAVRAERFDRHPGTAVLTRLRTLLAPVRTPVWIAGAAGIAALVVAFTVIPGVGPGEIARTDAQVGAGRPAQTLVPSPDPGPTTGSATAGAGSAAALTHDDPLAATAVLLARRASCISRKSISCLAGIDQPNSAALEADSHRVRQLKTAGGPTSPPPATELLALVQRLGDSAIIGLGAPTTGSLYPTSVLVVKTDAGWRLRDLTTAASIGG
jgi:hypothetical protein